jgi:hypothetical protein
MVVVHVMSVDMEPVGRVFCQCYANLRASTVFNDDGRKRSWWDVQTPWYGARCNVLTQHCQLQGRGRRE